MRVSWDRKLRGFVQRGAPLMITCKELEGLVVDDLDVTLSWRPHLVFRLHLFLCRECRDYVIWYRRAIALAKAFFRHPDEATPKEVPEVLVRAILAARKGADK